MAEENGDATWLKSTFKLMISQLRRCWKLAEVAGARGLMRRPAEVAGVGGRPLLCDRSPSTASGVAARAEGAPDSGGAARELLKAGDGRRGSSTCPPLLGGPASSTGGTASSAQSGGRPAGERDQIRREPSSGASSGASSATATALSRP
jgi:hypothetical protein